MLAGLVLNSLRNVPTNGREAESDPCLKWFSLVESGGNMPLLNKMFFCPSQEDV